MWSGPLYSFNGLHARGEKLIESENVVYVSYSVRGGWFELRPSATVSSSALAVFSVSRDPRPRVRVIP